MSLRNILIFTACAGVLAAFGCSSDPAPAPVANVDAGAADTTVAPTSLRFVAVGDTGKGNAGQRAVAAGIAAKCAASGCDFAVLLGDNIYESGITSPDDPAIKAKFEDIYAAIDLEFQIVLGNHDYGGEGLGTEFDKAQHEVAYSEKSAKWRLPAPHYKFEKTHADFVALDTNLMMFGRDDDQKQVVPGWIEASAARWKIALGHHPYISNGPHGNAGKYDGLASTNDYAGTGVKQFLDSIVCGKVDLYLSAHDHSMQWPTETCKGTVLAVAGTGASPTSLPGKNKTNFQSLALGFLYVTVTESTLTAEFVDDKGTTLHSETLSK